MGQYESRQQEGQGFHDSILFIEAFGFSREEALHSLEALLLIRHKTQLQMDNQSGSFFVRGRNQEKSYFIQHQTFALDGKTFHRLYLQL
jgi:hypothetical protein